MTTLDRMDADLLRALILKLYAVANDESEEIDDRIETISTMIAEVL